MLSFLPGFLLLPISFSLFALNLAFWGIVVTPLGILKLLLDLQAREGVAYLFITHDLATVRAIADRIAVMYRGEILDIVDSKVTREELGLLMAGVTSAKAGAE